MRGRGRGAAGMRGAGRGNYLAAAAARGYRRNLSAADVSDITSNLQVRIYSILDHEILFDNFNR